MNGSHLSMSQFASRLDFEQAQAAHSGKQLAQYVPSEYQYIRVGAGAVVTVAAHPAAGQRDFVVSDEVNTSTVLWYNTDTGVFETKNSRYVPASLVREAFPVDPAC